MWKLPYQFTVDNQAYCAVFYLWHKHVCKHMLPTVPPCLPQAMTDDTSLVPQSMLCITHSCIPQKC